jgi:hypothetical protein
LGLVPTHDGLLGVGQASLELPNALADRRADLGQPLGAEEQQDHHQNHRDFTEAEVSHGAPY